MKIDCFFLFWSMLHSRWYTFLIDGQWPSSWNLSIIYDSKIIWTEINNKKKNQIFFFVENDYFSSTPTLNRLIIFILLLISFSLFSFHFNSIRCQWSEHSMVFKQTKFKIDIEEWEKNCEICKYSFPSFFSGRQ